MDRLYLVVLMSSYLLIITLHYVFCITLHVVYLEADKNNGTGDYEDDNQVALKTIQITAEDQDDVAIMYNQSQTLSVRVKCHYTMIPTDFDLA